MINLVMNLDQLKKNIIFNFQNMENLFVYYRHNVLYIVIEEEEKEIKE